MDLTNLVRSKQLSEEITFALFDILRRDNVVEGLIDFIADRINNEAIEHDEDISDLKAEISRLESELDSCSEAKEELEAYMENEQLKSENFSDFVEKFIEENDRHPSIDETWEAAWNGCMNS